MARWHEVYLRSPVWRFALAPGLCGESGWTGIIHPGVDRVGRLFPLTVARPLACGTGLADCVLHTGAWHDAMAALAQASCSPEFSLDDFEKALRLVSACPGWPARLQDTPHLATRPAHLQRWGARMGVPKMRPGLPDMAELRTSTSAAHSEHSSLWWLVEHGTAATALFACSGLPGRAAFSRSFDAFAVLAG